MKLLRFLLLAPCSLLLAFASALLLGGCASAPSVRPGYVLIPELPAWRAPADPSPVTFGQVFPVVFELAPGTQLLVEDATFTRVNYDFALESIAWTLAVYSGPREREFRKARADAFVDESWDCAKFAAALTLAINRAAGRAGVKAQPLAARVYVRQVHAWGGIPSTGPPPSGHAVVGLATDRGILIVEPQTGATTKFDQYPNRAHVWRVLIGG